VQLMATDGSLGQYGLCSTHAPVPRTEAWVMGSNSWHAMASIGKSIGGVVAKRLAVACCSEAGDTALVWPLRRSPQFFQGWGRGFESLRKLQYFQAKSIDY
jgi:hypothetical protein